ncbi:hypothetical protein CCL45_gp29 [Sulfolobus islandicus rod-shaped virus 5]|uniref:C2H2-type domain-containing protein n=2 Tax=Usarudivirus SIRV5 TaxID=2846591 RepID=A0A1X9SKI0_9VIRU|nr:hypothetical protein CCL45_gp29 [Sulfolobus islandicus rod-shaped virus 5]YP_009362890.1 hypothetical protein CCL44_gp28 [Sulfolobus islandicus rod-shaped phage 6]ARQ96651.1 hypothetical protein [Sulfolobus islandicus rod-shaped virus 5]ARQ96757.1 hypothetical protein [Sulfolobus islandicus rod-shaped phage 6]
MTNKKVQVKSQNKLLFCTLCSFIAQDEEELDHHIKMTHEEDPNVEEEFQVYFVNKKEYEKILQNDYLRICKSKVCVIRRQIDIEDDKQEIKRLFKEYCSTCELKKLLLSELKQNGKM